MSVLDALGNEWFENETALQTRCVDWARNRGWFARKYKGPGRRSHPDYLFLLDGHFLFVEFKHYGKEPTKLQQIEGDAMRAAGADVVYLDSFEDFKAVIRDRENARPTH